MTALAAALLLAAGCGPVVGRQQSEGRQTPEVSPSRTPSPSASAAPSATATPGVPGPDFCAVSLPAAWRQHLTAGRIPVRPGESLTVHAVGDDGSTAVADSRLGDTRTVLFLRGGSRQDVLRMAGQDQLYGAGFDGRYLVFSVSHDPADLAAWTLYAWDSTTAAPPRMLARNAVDDAGHPAPGPMLYPVISDGVAAWTAGRPDGTTELHRYTLLTGDDQVVRAGHPGTPFLFGGDLVWPESPKPDALTALHAVAMETGTPAALPGALAAVRGPAFIAGTGDAAAWVDADVHSLWVWRPTWPRPVRALRVAEGRNLQWVRVAGDLVTWDDGTAQFGADLRTGSYAQLTPRYGYTVADGDALAVGYAPASKTDDGAPPTLVRVSDLPPLPGCA
ncbi:hypothetical protein [Actinocatenispora rupis]|uniref:Uncharacterized protein n=1 Tax=Actinocatenispora rupis TaxID=519421 RepID=A0A8J3J617_9ACTN|nr:hypothetical protein [Actinocatenispora rupis]GID10749.1 hypothetical protein Aru02nite_16380 [Actinocatenispora rupis]